MSVIIAKEIVVIRRDLRDGTATEERAERWLAELIVGCIPYDEPNVASARIFTLAVDDYRLRKYPAKRAERAQSYRQALRLADAAFGTNLQQVRTPLVA
jgi:hypothetical protein